MAVSVVGDADPAAIVKTIEQYFGPMKPKRAAVPEPERALPPHAETVISIASDSEAQASTVTLMRTSPTLEDDRVGDYRRDLVRRLMFQMMNVRFGELARKADAPFLAAGTGEDTITAKSSATTVGAQAEDGRILDALRAMIVEARRARQFGFSEFELEQGRRRLLSFYETAVAEKGKTESASYADEYIRNFLTGEPFPGIQAEYDMTHAMLPGVTLAEIGESAKDLLQEDNRAVLIAAPDKASVKLPDEAAVRQALSQASTQAIEPWKPQEAHSQLIGAPPVPGHITGTREIAPLGVTVVTLSNGVDVWLKSTDFKNDEVLITGVARGGAANAPADDYLNTVLAASLVNVAGVGGIPPPELASMLAGRLANVTPFIDLATRGVRGAARPQDLELALQLTYLNFTSPNADEASLALMKRQLNALVANRQTDPGAAFADKVRSLNTGDSRLVRPISSEGIASLKLDKMHQAYVNAFGNAADFTFFIVGTFKVDDVKPLLERYVASLPSKGQKSADVPKPIDFRFPAAVDPRRSGEGPRAEKRDRHHLFRRRDDRRRHASAGRHGKRRAGDPPARAAAREARRHLQRLGVVQRHAARQGLRVDRHRLRQLAGEREVAGGRRAQDGRRTAKDGSHGRGSAQGRRAGAAGPRDRRAPERVLAVVAAVLARDRAGSPAHPRAHRRAEADHDREPAQGVRPLLPVEPLHRRDADARSARGRIDRAARASLDDSRSPEPS